MLLVHPQSPWLFEPKGDLMVEVHLFVKLNLTADVVVYHAGFHYFGLKVLSITFETDVLVLQFVKSYRFIKIRTTFGPTQNHILFITLFLRRLFAQLKLSRKSTFLKLFLRLDYVGFSFGVLDSLGRTGLTRLSFHLWRIFPTRSLIWRHRLILKLYTGNGIEVPLVD